MKYDSLIFDLDGTLWDSSESVYQAWIEVLQKEFHAQSVPSIQDIHSIMGCQLQAIADRLFSYYGAERYTVLDHCLANENVYLRRHGGRLYPLVPETLARLAKSYRLAIVSNCQEGYIDSFLSYHGLQSLFQDFQWENGRSKEINIRLLADRNGFQKPLYIGDTTLDQCSARQAGVDFLWAAYGFGTNLTSELQIAAFEQLPRLLETL